MRVVLIGDVFGRPGLDVVRRVVPDLRRELRLDLVVANGENAAAGRGMTRANVAELRESGVDVITSGNHVWDQREMLSYLPTTDDVLRPLNYPPAAPGQGCWAQGGVMVINLMGRLFMRDMDCPFRVADRLLREQGDRARIRIVDFHAEATSEKQALAWYLDGRVSAVVGTHTHVPTADARILPGGTATVTDLGMSGPHESVIGVTPGVAVGGFLTALPQKFEVAGGPLAQFNSVLIEIDEQSGRARSIERVDRLIDLSIDEEECG